MKGSKFDQQARQMMTELFDDEDEEVLNEDNLVVETDETGAADHHDGLHARRRLEMLLEEKRLKKELEDFIDDL